MRTIRNLFRPFTSSPHREIALSYTRGAVTIYTRASREFRAASRRVDLQGVATRENFALLSLLVHFVIIFISCEPVIRGYAGILKFKGPWMFSVNYLDLQWHK